MLVRSFALAVVGWLGLSASTAHAYCRTHTQDPRMSSCPEICAEEGLPLYWPKPNLTYSFNERGFPGLYDDDLRRIIAQSFKTWENVRCDGELVGLEFSANEEPTTLEVGPKEGPNKEPNENVVVHYDRTEWAKESLPARAFAITAVWFDERSGRILGADMMFNGGMDPFGECSGDSCGFDDPNVDLRNVATHEIGHFLGLSHSDVEDSTMWCDARPEETGKRSLSTDDTDGLCDIYPPETSFAGYRSTPDEEGEGCSVGGASRSPGAMGGGLLVAALALLVRRRRG